jgi:hypothetical protein
MCQPSSGYTQCTEPTLSQLVETTTFKSTHRSTLLQKSNSLNVNTVNMTKDWIYPLMSHIDTEYHHVDGQRMFEFAYRVSIHNREVNDKVDYPLPLSPPSFDIKVPLNTTVLRIDANVAWFFYSASLNLIVITFTGTYNRVMTYADIDYNQAGTTILHNHQTGIYAHGGFLGLYQGIQPMLLTLLDKYVMSTTQVLITGFSLGGATSTLAALDLYRRPLSNGIIIENLRHFSFASPRVLNTIGSSHFDTLGIVSHRVSNDSDLVVAVPGPVMPVTQDFTHIGQIILFNTNLKTLYDNHVTAYVQHFAL